MSKLLQALGKRRTRLTVLEEAQLTTVREAALQEASDRELLKEITRRGEHDEQFRRALTTKVKALGAGKRGQRRPLGEAAHIVSAFECALKLIGASGKRATLEGAADLLIAGPFSGRSRDRLLKLYREFGQK